MSRHIHFMEVTRSDGRKALIKPDAITAILVNHERQKGAGEAVVVVTTVQLGPNLALNLTESPQEVLDLVSRATAVNAVIVKRDE